MPTFLPGLYPPGKDLFLWLKGERQDIIDLEGRLRSLVIELIKIRSEKGKIDESLRTYVTKKKSGAYAVIETEIKSIFQKYNKFISKYRKITNALPELTGELDEPTASAMIKELEQKSPKIFTASFFKLSDLSRDIDKLKTRASECLGNIKPNNLIENDSEAYDEKLNDESGNDHPVFTKYVDKVLGYLSAGNYGNRVGIIGPVGVGKTTVMRKLYNRLMDTKLLFNGDNNSRLDNIIWIPEKMTIEKVQDEIMLQLQIHHEKTDSMHVNAIVIFKFLRQRKYILLIDHVSESIDLNKLGLREDHKYRNVVVASSDRKAISSMIKDEVEIERLNNKEALELFEKIHGKINDKRLEGIADRIVEFCGGLALVIKSVATYLKNKKGESSWTEVKRNLQSPTKSVSLMGLSGIDYIYKERYDELHPSFQKCLLFTALFPNEQIIFKDYLIECWMAECFIKEDDDQKLRRTRDSGQAILDQLTDVYLLDWCLEGKYVKMPSIFRRVALELKYPHEETCLIWVPSDDKRLEEETWKTVTRMSLIWSETKLPESPECSNISTLLLGSMPELSKLADAFFLHMTRLHVLDLYQTGIVRLPSSVGKLVDLKSLCLNRCKHLEMLPPEASQLTKLEFLDICGTSIPSLPQEVKFMVDLRCLRATFSPTQKEGEDLHVDVIPLEIIQNLKKLEELSINAGLYSPSSETAELLAIELASLEYLTTLHFNFPNVKAFNTFVTESRSLKNKQTSWGSDTFRYFKIFVGGHDIQHAYESDVSKLLAERRLRFSGDEGFSSAGSELLRQTCAFELIGDKGLETLSPYDLRSVKVCVVGSCSHLKNIVDGNTIAQSGRGVFKDLEKLHLYDLQLLECLWKTPSIPQGLHRLTVITLRGCPNLTRILDPELSRALPSLKHLKVDNCRRISQIVEVPNESNNRELDDMLNSVLSVELINLPCLQSVCSRNSLSWKWNSLDSMVIRGCSKLSNMSLTQTNAKRLTSITCERSWWNQLQLAKGVKQRLLPFCRFVEESSEPGERPDQETANDIIPSAAGEERAEQKVSSFPSYNDLNQALIIKDAEYGKKDSINIWEALRRR
ncbi:hypothetical protein ACS0TY_026244 [Phlomoides rotata]